MSVIKSLLCSGAGLLLTACGGGGGSDGIGGSSYDNQIVVRVEFDDGPEFRDVAAENGDYSQVTVTFDVDETEDASEGDFRLRYRRQYSGSAYTQYFEFQHHDGNGFVQETGIVQATFVGNTMEWVIDTAALEDLLAMSTVLTEEDTWLRVDARKYEADVLTEDFIPNSASASVFSLLNSSGYVTDAEGDFSPLSGHAGVDLRSVGVLFYD